MSPRLDAFYRLQFPKCTFYQQYNLIMDQACPRFDLWAKCFFSLFRWTRCMMSNKRGQIIIWMCSLYQSVAINQLYIIKETNITQTGDKYVIRNCANQGKFDELGQAYTMFRLIHKLNFTYLRIYNLFSFTESLENKIEHYKKKQKFEVIHSEVT